MLREVASLTDLPLLKKDFITRDQQIAEAKSLGASAILLTAKILPKTALPKVIERTLAAGLTPFVEVVDEDELGRVTHPEECIVAVNNKDIKGQERDAGDIDVSRAMLDAVQRTGTPCPVSASAITDPRVGAELVHAGFKGLLIGTGLLQSESVAGWVEEFERQRAALGSPAAAGRSPA
jgi:indole-3-glycerol phosphate synthase